MRAIELSDHASETQSLFDSFDPNQQIVELSDEEIDNAENSFGEGE